MEASGPPAVCEGQNCLPPEENPVQDCEGQDCTPEPAEVRLTASAALPETTPVT